MPVATMLRTTPAMIWSIRHLTVVQARKPPRMRPHPTPERDADDEGAAVGRAEEAGEGGDEQLALDADVDDPAALADDTDEGAEHERDGIGPRVAVHRQGGRLVGEVVDAGQDEDDDAQDDRELVALDPRGHVSSPARRGGLDLVGPARKIHRPRTGIDTSSRVIARIRSTISGAMPVANCRPAAPVRRMPTRKAAGIVQIGLDRASRAMVMPSKPKVPPMAGSEVVHDAVHLHGAGQAREPSGEHHREEDDPVDRDAGIPGGELVLPDRVEAETHRRAAEHPATEDRERGGDDEAEGMPAIVGIQAALSIGPVIGIWLVFLKAPDQW